MQKNDLDTLKLYLTEIVRITLSSPQNANKLNSSPIININLGNNLFLDIGKKANRMLYASFVFGNTVHNVPKLRFTYNGTLPLTKKTLVHINDEDFCKFIDWIKSLKKFKNLYGHVERIILEEGIMTLVSGSTSGAQSI